MNKDKIMVITVLLSLALIIIIMSIPYFSHGAKPLVPSCNYNLNKKVVDATFNEGFFLAPEIIIDHSIVQHQERGYTLSASEISATPNVIDRGFSYKDNKKFSACLERVDLVFHNAAQTLQENECFALAYLNDRTVNKIKSIQAMPCDEIEKTMAYWTSVNDVKGMRFIPNPEPPIR